MFVYQNQLFVNDNDCCLLTTLFSYRLLVSVKTLKLQMHTTLDPYNTTEEVELTFGDANFDWTNG
jgi:hypothetical protein